uniref:Protochlorophyllide reductase n=1 Tax=Chlamydomonas leiostraca TaxID=1034604 RepID=A0A7S0RX28_9CHLO|mmetsp:Transcript_33493/g.84871  ORF Transcript_33493/g.84871 Transcript_33493/m.84871 type:complete len:316 (+) Transcript_33493:89-1036(+)
MAGDDLKGKIALVTGSTSGIGLETAAALAARGATVVLGVRNVDAAREVADKIVKRYPGAKVDLPPSPLDLYSQESVRRFAAEFDKKYASLHILVNNAGIYAMGAPREQTSDGFEAHMAANHLGHFLLTLSLLPALQRGAAAKPAFGARVVNVSSSVHMMAPKGILVNDPHLAKQGAYASELAYAQSKLAQILFTRELNARLAATQPNIHSLALHPGMVLTEVTRSLPWLIRMGNKYIMGAMLLTPIEGARASVYCATSPTAPQEGAATAGYFDANCRPLAPSLAAQDPAAALWCWRWSAQQVGLPPQLDLPEPRK